MTNKIQEHSTQRKVRGIYLLPNLFTIAGMFAGFYAIIAGLQGYFENAVMAILIALIADGLDGRIARWTNSQSEMGAELDSLADMVSFGIAPAMLMYSWSLVILGKPGWLAAFIYMVCTGLRLARFNSQGQGDEKRYFSGLNTPCAAALAVSTIWTFTHYDVDGMSLAIPMAILMLLLGLLKVSNIRYRSFKDLDLRTKKVSLTIILLFILLLVLVSLNPPETLLLIVLSYVLSGPIMFVMQMLTKRPWRRKKNSS